MNLTLRQETSADHHSVFKVVKEAFLQEKLSDHKEQFLVERLRKSAAFIPELSIVAEIENKIVGYILLTKIKIIGADRVFNSLALAPVAIKPEYQNQGIGGKLISHAHKRAKDLGHYSIVLVGHKDYYPRFGYEHCKMHNIKLPFDVPEENCFVIELKKNGLQGVTGTVEYPNAFFD